MFMSYNESALSCCCANGLNQTQTNCPYGSPTRARTWDLRINSPTEHMQNLLFLL